MRAQRVLYYVAQISQALAKTAMGYDIIKVTSTGTPTS